MSLDPHNSTRQRSILCYLCLMLLWLLPLIGCSEPDEELEERYGKISGYGAAESVNGTAVLAEMLRLEGYKVTSKSYFTPILNDADVIIWFPNNFKGPTVEEREALDGWLNRFDKPRVFVYVGRDYDATIQYWQKMLAIATTKKEKLDCKKRLKAAKEAFLQTRIPADPAPDNNFEWFDMVELSKRKKIPILSGPWAKILDYDENAELELETYLKPRVADYDHLLEADINNKKYSFAFATDINAESDNRLRNRRIIVNNGSFLLNLPLVNHQHRRFAQKMIEDIQSVSPEGTIVFLESESDGLNVSEQEPIQKSVSMSSLFSKPPLSYWFIHLIVLSVFFFFSMWPIFGRPKQIKEEGLSDFGSHVSALGRLFNRTQDSGYAWQRIKFYRQKVRGETNENKPKE